MKKTHVIFYFCFIAGTITFTGDTEKSSHLRTEIIWLTQDINLIDIELAKNITHKRYPDGSTYTNFDISSKEAMALLGKRAKAHDALERKQEELESYVAEKRSKLEHRIGELTEEIHLLDIKLEQYATEQPRKFGEGYISFDISRPEARDLLDARAMRCNLLERDQQALNTLTGNR